MNMSNNRVQPRVEGQGANSPTGAGGVSGFASHGILSYMRGCFSQPASGVSRLITGRVFLMGPPSQVSPWEAPSGFQAMAEAGRVGVFHDTDPLVSEFPLQSCLPYPPPPQLPKLPATQPHHHHCHPPVHLIFSPAPTCHLPAPLSWPWDVSGWPFHQGHPPDHPPDAAAEGSSQTPSMSSSRMVSAWCPSRQNGLEARGSAGLGLPA